MRWVSNSKMTWGALLVCTMLAGYCLSAEARGIKFSTDLGEPVVLEGKKQTAYLKVRIEGEALPGAERAPANVAIVIDKSGSMSGEKIRHAKEAALMAIDKLNAKDIVSVVLYDSTVDVLVPATKASDKQAIRNRLYPVGTGGSTALFGGVSKGAGEIRKFLDLDRVNRIILLSDGLANVGPSSPKELGNLGASLEKQGISITTIGLGLDYNEDLMAQLARRSNGSHLFAERPSDLENAYAREFGDLLTAIAQNARVTVTCAEGVRPVRIVGRDGTIDGQNVSLDLGQVYGKQVKYAIIEVEVPAGEKGYRMEIASAQLNCYSLQSKANEEYADSAAVRFTDSEKEVEDNRDAKTMISVVRQIGTEQTSLARELRDEGKIEEAREVLDFNGIWIMDNAARFDSSKLREDGADNDMDMQNLDEENWKQRRKVMMDKEMANQMQSLGYLE